MTSFITVLRRTFPFRLKNEEFAEKIGLISIGISLVIIALIMSLFVLYTKQKRQQELIADGFALTDMVARYSAMGLEITEANNIMKIVNMMGSKSGLVYGMIMDVNGRVIIHTNINLVDHVLTDPITLRAASSNNPLKQVYKDPDTDNRIHEFSRPLYGSGKKVGAVRLGFSQDINPLFSDSDIRGLLLIATLIFALAPIFYYVLRRSPRLLASLNKEFNNVLAKNNFETRAVNSGKATSTVEDKFRHVISQYKDRYQKLSVSCEDMEVANSVLSYEKERIESVIDSLDDGIIVRDLVGCIIHVNRAMAYLMNVSRQKIIGNTLQDSIDNEEIISFIERNQLNGNSFTQKNLKVTLKQFGGEKIVLISYLPLLSPEESVLGSIIIAKDITAAKMAQQNQSDFIAHVSHELRTPLTTIKSYVEMLMDDEISDGNTKIDFYNTINDEANRLSRLINNLLNISKIETGSLIINKDMIKTREFFEDIVQSIKPQAISKNINLESIVPDKVSALVVEKDLLRVSILNILGNAIKYTPAGGSITFKSEEDDSHVTVDISDTGYGISEEELPHIFDKFFRSSEEKIKKHTGNGLGLALSREIIRLHGGKIDVISNLGQGTHFTLKLPKEDSPRISNYNKRLSSLIDNQ
jgi:PAS domain S-box-containing protein